MFPDGHVFKISFRCVVFIVLSVLASSLSILTANFDGKILILTCAWWTLGWVVVWSYCKYWTQKYSEKEEKSNNGSYQLYSANEYAWSLAVLAAIGCVKPIDMYTAITIAVITLISVVKIYTQVAWIDEIKLNVDSVDQTNEICPCVAWPKAEKVPETRVKVVF